MKRKFYLRVILTFVLLIFYEMSYSQCGINVPLITIDLTGAPDSTWTLQEVDAPARFGQCCGAESNENCISFEIILDENSAGIFFDYDGAPGFGSLNWQVDCGPEYNLKDTICISGPGTYTLTFCKPGSDNGNYSLTSVPYPTFPEDQTVPLNCVQPMEVLGVTADQVTWTSISPGTPGQYDYLLDCNDCLTPTFTPDPAAPSVIEYQICGYPLLDQCTGAFTFCDTMSITTQDSLLVSVTPENATYCSGGNTIVTASATGGDGNYSFFWYNSSLDLVETGTTFTTGTSGTYTVEVRDGNYELGACNGFFKTFSVSETLPPNVNAGSDQVICATNPTVSLSGLIEHATGGNWSNGSGTFFPSNTDIICTYEPTNTEIANGSVTLHLNSTGAGGGCVDDMDEITIFFVDTIKVELTDTTLNCNNSTLNISPTATGGLAPLTYLWSNGATTLNTTLGEGTHCLTITDANGCSTSECFTISTPPSLLLTMSSTPATTIGGNDGEASVAVTGGTPPYNYSWNSGGNLNSETGLSYGIYIVTVTDDKGCVQTGSVVVNDPACLGFNTTINSNNVSCFGGNNGNATVSMTGGTAPFSHVWDDPLGQTDPTATNLEAGIYLVTTTDLNGCITLSNTTITEPTQLSNIFTSTNVTTQGGNDGDAQVNVSGGTPGYSYLWSTTDTDPNISNLTTGWYNVTITDGLNCTLEDSLFISEPPCNDFSLYVSSQSVTCNGENNGEAEVNIIGGSGPYSIVWSTGAADTTKIDNLTAGFYSVTVTDNLNCMAFSNFGISEPSELIIGLLATPSNCYGDDKGTIDVTVTGGTFPSYYFNWNDGPTQEDRINLAIGTYTVQVQDENGCTAIDSVLITQPDSIQVASNVNHVTCFEGTDGSITTTVLGGVGSYSFMWSNGETTQNLTDLDVGGYILSLTDANLCSTPDPISVILTQPDKVELDSFFVNCPMPGQTLTEVELFPLGGNAPYSPSFDSGNTYLTQGDYNVDQTIGASYAVVLKDQNDCYSDTLTIEIDTVVFADQINFNTCYVAPQFEEVVSIIPAGGEANYSISLDNGVTFQPYSQYDLTVAINGTYQIVVKDTNDCYSETYQIVLPDTLAISPLVTSDYNGQDISCFNESDGSAILNASGGTEPYSFAWSNSETTAAIDNLSANTYFITITDDNGCQRDTSITLTQPDLLTTVTAITSNYNGYHVSCHNSDDGTAITNPNGGTMPYSYLWSNGQTTNTSNGLSSDTYDVTITDVNGCNIESSVFLNEPDTLSISVAITDVSCNGGNDGEIDVTSSGGVLPYSYLWSNGETTEDVINLSAGTYEVSLTDANGCIYLNNEIVVDPTLIDLDISVSNVTCNGFEDGALDLSVSGGTPPYDIDWNNGANSEDLSGLDIGTYTATVTDDHGCYTDIMGTVTQPDSLITSIVLSEYFHGHNLSDHQSGDGSIDATTTGGTPPYEFYWSSGDSTESLDGIPAGDYSLLVIDQNNCEFELSTTLTEPFALEVPTGITPNDDGDNDLLYIRGLEVYPGSSVTIINQWGNVVYQTDDYQNDWRGTNSFGNPLPDGTYFVVLVLNNGSKLNSYLDLRKN